MPYFRQKQIILLFFERRQQDKIYIEEDKSVDGNCTIAIISLHASFDKKLVLQRKGYNC
jgi:hypothetical protein